MNKQNNEKKMNVGLLSLCAITILCIVGECQSCPVECSTCAPPTSSTCTGCIDGYYLNSSNCNLCNSILTFGGLNCATCDITQCLTCVDGAVFDTSTPPKCVSCTTITNCLNCSTLTICTHCKTYYMLDTSNPPLCVPNCTSIAQCLTCTVGSLGPVCLTCNSSFYLNSTLNKCLPCTDITNCLDCLTNGKCTSCSTDYFIDFSTNNKTCTSCNIYQCLTCTDGPICTACKPGYYLNSIYNLCFICNFPCLQCNKTSSNCTKCPTSKLYYLDNTTFTCKPCSNKLTNCTKCNQNGDICQQCVSNYFYLDATNQCVNCVAPCLQCFNSTICLSCVDFNYTLMQSTNTCETCLSVISFCQTCLTQTVCLSCTTTGGPYFLTYPPKKCVTCQQAHPQCQNCSYFSQFGPGCTLCNPAYFIDNHYCVLCPEVCFKCDNLTYCTQCVNTYYALSNNMCVLCNRVLDNCLQCTSATVCTVCGNNTIPDFNGQCKNCSLTQYPDVTNQVCKPCVTPCYSCLNQDDCLTCNLFYEYDHAIKRCKDVCGDGIVMTDQCDNTLGIINDGCSDTCQQEPDFTCVLNPDTVSGQSVQRSICSYNLKVNITLKQVIKEPFKNTLTWTYSITPFLYGLPGTTSRDFTQQQLKNVFVLYDMKYSQSNATSLTIGSVSVNALGSEVSVTFSYDQDIRELDIDLMVNFTYLKSNLNIQNFTTTPDSQKVIKGSSYHPESLIGKFYTGDQYSLASTLNKFALLISIMSFAAFIIGLFSKELVGLEMTMLCQFTYISLFYYEGILELPLFALKSLAFSTGYNFLLTDRTYKFNQNDPPQSFALDFDVTTFSNNFNLMGLLYVLPLLFVIPFIPMKAKCIRKLSWIEMGNKWVDLLLGEIMLYIVLFNLQYFLFGLIVFYQDGGNTKDYLSEMIIPFGLLCTISSILGLIFKPQIYGDFRTSFKFNTDYLISEAVLSKKQGINGERNERKEQKQKGLNNRLKNVRILINENYFWRRFRQFHTIMTYNHYVMMSILFIVIVLVQTLMRHSQILMLIIWILLLVELILMRPYGRICEKLRSIYFALSYFIITLIRYINNHFDQGDRFCLGSSVIILAFLIVALLWTYIVLIKSIIEKITELLSNKNATVQKVFKNNFADNLDKEAVAEQQEALMRKLMKRYERVQLQYNINKVRDELLAGQDTINATSVLAKDLNHSSPISKQQKSKIDSIQPLTLGNQEQTKNYKDLKKNLQREKRKKKRQQMKNKVSGEKMLKLLKLDNFSKYEEQFLMPDEEKKNRDLVNKQQHKEQKQGQQSEEKEEKLQKKEKDENISQEEDSIINELDDYKSIEPQNAEETKQKLNQESVLIEENQFLRYERAKKIIANQGLEVDKNLIQQNYHNI